MNSAMSAIVKTLAVEPKTAKQRRREIDRRHYEQNRDRYLLHRKVQILRKWVDRITEALHAHS